MVLANAGMSSVASKPALLQFGAVLFDPQAAIADIGARPPSSARAFFGAAVWLGLLPPLFAYIGTLKFGWRLGVEPMYLPQSKVLAIAWRISGRCCSGS